MTVTDKIADLSDYEKLRAKNIERNNKRLCGLGLLTKDTANALNATAWRRGENLKRSDSCKNDNLKGLENKTKKSKLPTKTVSKKNELGEKDPHNVVIMTTKRKSLRRKTRLSLFRAERSVWI
mmetsp:Transcript_23666/g.27912  ORF Transcript_23666/g.27912 Transcript_23666/m.27912 type:complete len:123 (+) Transcript_23666:27-395(+)